LPEAVLNLTDVSGLPDPNLQPPTFAEPGDPFAELRVVHLLARIPRAEPVRLRDLVDRLNADYVDWSFSRRVVIAAIVQLQANWMADYRNSEGITLTEGVAGPIVTIEDSSRVNPWILRQADRLSCACTERLRAFAVEEGVTP
jgi:hypothetical protein